MFNGALVEVQIQIFRISVCWCTWNFESEWVLTRQKLLFGWNHLKRDSAFYNWRVLYERGYIDGFGQSKSKQTHQPFQSLLKRQNPQCMPKLSRLGAAFVNLLSKIINNGPPAPSPFNGLWENSMCSSLGAQLGRVFIGDKVLISVSEQYQEFINQTMRVQHGYR